MNGVLILNKNYTPVGRRPATIKRALSLVHTGRAEVIELTDNRIRTISVDIPVPSIIRLKEFVRVPDPGVRSWSKRGLFERDGYVCQYCLKQLKRDEATVDHVVPQSKFKNKRDASTWDNTVCACKPCNQRKKNRTPEQAKMSLKSFPRKPQVDLTVLYGNEGMPDSWKVYFVTKRHGSRAK